MRLLQGMASITAGFLLLPLLMRLALGAILTLRPDLVPSTDPVPVTFMTVNLALTAVMAAASGAVTAMLAPEPPFLWVLLLAFFVFAGGIVFGVQQLGGNGPTWYLLGLPLVSGMSIGSGGWAFLAWRQARADRKEGKT